MSFTVTRFINTFMVLLLMSVFAASSAAKESAEKQSSEDRLIKSEVETAVSMLQAIYTKHQQGEMSLGKAKELGADLLRELRYGREGYFWADTTEGVNVVLYGRKDVEGRNRIDDRDQNGIFFIREFVKAGKAGGGYVEYWFPKKGETIAIPKRSYVLLFKPFGWVVGSGYYPQKVQNHYTAAELEHFVRQGAALISEKGEKAFDALRQKGSSWFHDDRYLYVWDMNGMRYVYPPYPQGEGKNMLHLKDVDDKPIGKLMVDIAASKEGRGWLHYRWPKPGQTTPEWKSTYVMKVRSPSGKAYLIGSGAYDLPVQKSFVVDAVDSAVKLIEREGVKAFDTLRDRRSQYLYQDTYVFVIAENGLELVNAAFPKLEGRNVMDYKDADGNYMVKAFIEVARSKGDGWVDYVWPKPGDVERYQKSTYVRKVMVDGRMFVVCAGLYMD